MTWGLSANRSVFTGGPGWLVSAYPGGGILGSAIPATGSNGHASPLFNDITLPAEANDEFAWRIVSGPAGGGAFVPYEDGSFYYLGPSTSFVYEGFKNYISYGTATVTMGVGAGLTGSMPAENAGMSGSTGPASVLTGSMPAEDAGMSGSTGPASVVTGNMPAEDAGMSGTFSAGVPIVVTPGSIPTPTTSTRHSLKLLVPASQTPVTLAEAKTQLRVDTADDDLLIEAFIFAATEAAEQLLGRAIMPQTWQLTHDSFPGLFELTRPRVLGVVSITYVDETGTTQTLAPTSYALDSADDYGFAYVVPALGAAWPASAAQMNAVVLNYQAGYSSAADVPRGIKAWVLLAVRAMYDGCKDGESATVGTLGPVDRLLDPFKVYSV